MASARVLAVWATLLGIVLASGGCFRPKVVSGGFMCDLTKGAKACPDNFVCDLPSGRCVTPHDGGIDLAQTGGHGGAGGAAGVGGGGGGENVDARPDVSVDVPCLPAVDAASCQGGDAGGMCDPVCNTGCADCHAKCSVNSNGVPTCNRLVPEPSVATPKGVLANCTQNAVGGTKQTDNCAPGAVCLGLECPSARCYRFCRVNADCANNASCSRDAGGGYRFCDVPPAVCDPVNPQVDSGCPPELTSEGCYLYSTSTAQTVCDCPYVAKQGGGIGERQPCTYSRQCGIGLVCFDPTGVNSPVCLPVCRLPPDGGTNTSCNGGPCSAFSASAGETYGYCR